MFWTQAQTITAELDPRLYKKSSQNQQLQINPEISEQNPETAQRCRTIPYRPGCSCGCSEINSEAECVEEFKIWDW